MPGSTLSDIERYSLAQLVIATNSPLVKKRIHDEVKVVHLRVPPRDSENAWGPGEDFIQLTDRSVPSDDGVIGVDFMLSGVSLSARRAYADFWNALGAIHIIAEELIQTLLAEGMQAQLYVRIGLDGRIPFLDRPGETSLPELGPTTVKGKRSFSSSMVSQEDLLLAELEARLGDRQLVQMLLEYASLSFRPA